MERGRKKRNTVYKPSATYALGKPAPPVCPAPFTRHPHLPHPPPYSCLFSSSVFPVVIVVCLPTCFFISLHFLLPERIIFFILQSHYLSVLLYDRIFNYATFLPLFICSLLRLLPLSLSFSPWTHCGRAVWGRSREKGRRGP